jgi:hypothetical protein
MTGKDDNNWGHETAQVDVLGDFPGNGGSVFCSGVCDALGGSAVIRGGGVSYSLTVGCGARVFGGGDGLRAGDCGTRLNEMGCVITGTCTNPVPLLLCCETVPHGGPHMVKIVQASHAQPESFPRRASPRKRIFGSSGWPGWRSRPRRA